MKPGNAPICNECFYVVTKMWDRDCAHREPKFKAAEKDMGRGRSILTVSCGGYRKVGRDEPV